MSTKGQQALAALALLVAVVSGCNPSGNNNNSNATAPNGNAANARAKSAPPTTQANADGLIASGTGTEKEKPEAGKANVQGKVFFNEQPAAGVEVKLCEKFNQFFGGCGGQTYSTKTDDGGEYLIKNVPPQTYEGLIVKVFNSNYYVFATSGIVQSAKYQIEADKTFFAPDTNLFKNDLKLQSPKAGSKVGADGIEVKWDSYPDAAYYKMSLFADTNSGAKAEYDFIGRRIEGQSFTLDKPLTPGAYTARVEAFNGNDVKLAQSSGDTKFTVTGGAAK
ncbi:MAG TPA: carboxypeptidase-like regulatory domain-containing protein [Pyrinomonadaceae bacterium]|nr:carboxypeptidase-like regulatory domain-containing protein [Pyrinomonadaceae bacterium]